MLYIDPLIGNVQFDPLINEIDNGLPSITLDKPLYINFYDTIDALTVNGSAKFSLDMIVNGDITVDENIYTKSLTSTGVVRGKCFESISDRNLKEYICPLNDNITIDNIRVYSYQYIGNTSTFYGVMAQDLLSNNCLKNIVSYNDTQKHYTVDYSQFIPILIKETQTLKKKIRKIETCLFIATLSVSAFALLSMSLKR